MSSNQMHFCFHNNIAKTLSTTFEEAKCYLIPRLNSNICGEKATTFEEANERARHEQYLIPKIDSNICDKKNSHNI